MEYSRYSPCLPEVQEKLIEDYQRSQGIVVDDKKKQKKNQFDQQLQEMFNLLIKRIIIFEL